MDKIIVTLWITFGIYLMVLLAIMADLWSGVRKAKKNGIARSSYGFKRTIDKYPDVGFVVGNVFIPYFKII